MYRNKRDVSLMRKKQLMLFILEKEKHEGIVKILDEGYDVSFSHQLNRYFVRYKALYQPLNSIYLKPILRNKEIAISRHIISKHNINKADQYRYNLCLTIYNDRNIPNEEIQRLINNAQNSTRN